MSNVKVGIPILIVNNSIVPTLTGGFGTDGKNLYFSSDQQFCKNEIYGIQLQLPYDQYSSYAATTGFGLMVYKGRNLEFENKHHFEKV